MPEDQPPPAASIGRGSPRIRSMTATGFLILARSRTSTRRLAPHCQHVRLRGKLFALTIPSWPHVQATLTAFSAPVVSAEDKPFAQCSSTTRPYVEPAHALTAARHHQRRIQRRLPVSLFQGYVLAHARHRTSDNATAHAVRVPDMRGPLHAGPRRGGRRFRRS